MSMELAELTKQDKICLKQYESLIQQGLQSFIEVGAALLHIRNGKLYSQTHKTFEAYCKDRWGFSRPRAYELIKSAKVSENLSEISDKPENDFQARELSRLPADQQAAAWIEAIETAPHGKVTASHVRKVVARRLPPKTQPQNCNDSGSDETEIDNSTESDFEQELNNDYCEEYNDDVFFEPPFDAEKACRRAMQGIDQAKSVISTVVRAETVGVDEFQRLAIADYLELLAQQLRT